MLHDVSYRHVAGGPFFPGTYVREQQLLAAIPFSRATLWRRIKSGDFPVPVRFGPRLNAWKADEVIAWLGAQKANG